MDSVLVWSMIECHFSWAWFGQSYFYALFCVVVSPLNNKIDSTKQNLLCGVMPLARQIHITVCFNYIIGGYYFNWNKCLTADGKVNEIIFWTSTFPWWLLSATRSIPKCNAILVSSMRLSFHYKAKELKVSTLTKIKSLGKKVYSNSWLIFVFKPTVNKFPHQSWLSYSLVSQHDYFKSAHVFCLVNWVQTSPRLHFLSVILLLQSQISFVTSQFSIAP